MNIVIAGANGFIGSWLTKELCENTAYSITALVRVGSNYSNLKEEKIVIKEIDYSNHDEVLNVLQNSDIYIHLIGQMGKEGVLDKQFELTNIELTKQMLLLCEKAGIKQFIFCSTPGVQGFGKRLASEEEPYAPRNMYEKTKVEAEKCVISFCNRSRIKYTIIRPDFVYGPGDIRRVKMYRGIKKGKFVLTTSGKSYLHPTYITDVTQGISKTINVINAYNQIFNISAENDVSSKDYLTAIANCVNKKLIHINIGYSISIFISSFIENFYKRLLHKEAFVTTNKIDFLAVNHSTSIEKAKKKLGYSPEIDIHEGMRRTIKWCNDNKYLE